MTRVIGKVVLWIDRVLRRIYGIYEFSSSSDCILRLAVTKARKARNLEDGTAVAPGDLIGELHLWNEHIPKMGEGGPDLGWGAQFYRLLTRSLRYLAEYADGDSSMTGVKAFRASVRAGGEAGYTVERLARRLGFQVLPAQEEAGLMRRLYLFFDGLYGAGLVLAFNRPSLKGKSLLSLSGQRELWISRRTLLERYGHPRTCSRTAESP